MKHLCIATTILLATAASANARINVDVGIFSPAPYYVPPAVYYQPAPPVYYVPPPHVVTYYNGRDRQRNYDWSYWRENDRRPHDNRGRRNDHRRDGDHRGNDRH